MTTDTVPVPKQKLNRKQRRAQYAVSSRSKPYARPFSQKKYMRNILGSLRIKAFIERALQNPEHLVWQKERYGEG